MSEPAWLPEAREMRARKTGYRTIAKRLDLSPQQVYYWLKVKPEPPRWEKTCAGCGKVFRARESRARYCSQPCGRSAALAPEAQAKRSATLARRNAGTGNPNYRHGRSEERPTRKQRERFQSGQRHCQHPGCDGAACGLQQHHVVYAQHVRVEGGDTADPRNALAVCPGCHGRHHRATAPIPVRVLRDENFAFAVELLGAGPAYEYIRRRYSGTDIRLERLLVEPSMHPVGMDAQSAVEARMFGQAWRGR